MRSTTSARHSVRGRTSGGRNGVLRVVELGALVVDVERRRRRVVRAAPPHELLLAELGQRLRLVLALQRAVVPLVQPPRPAHRDPQPVGGVEGQFGGADRPPLQRRVHDAGQQVVLDEQLAAAPGLGLALGREVDVDPPGEEVLLVPVALPVAEQHERGRHQACPAIEWGEYGASSRPTSSSLRSRPTEATASSMCAGLVAPMIGASTAGWRETQASATWARRHAAPLGHLGDGVDDPLVVGVVERLAELVGLAARRRRVPRPGEAAARQRAPRDHADAEVLAERQHLALLLPVQQVVVVLHRDERRPARWPRRRTASWRTATRTSTRRRGSGPCRP